MPHDDAMPHTDVPLPPPQPPLKWTVHLEVSVDGRWQFGDVTGWGFNGGIFSWTDKSGAWTGVSVDKHGPIKIVPA